MLCIMVRCWVLLLLLLHLDSAMLTRHPLTFVFLPFGPSLPLQPFLASLPLQPEGALSPLALRCKARRGPCAGPRGVQVRVWAGST